MRKQLGYTLVEVIVLLIVLLGGFGWIWNIVKIVQSDFVFTGLLVVRIIGIFVAPLGAVMGYF